MKYTLSIPYSDFEKKLSNDIDEFKSILEEDNISGKKLETLVNEKLDELKHFLNEKIQPEADIFLNILLYHNDSVFYDSPLFKKDLKNWARTKIENKIKSIEYIKEISSIVDSFVNPNKKIEKSLTVTEKIDFILEKLYRVFNDNFYSIDGILTLNNIDFREKEPEELAEELKKKGYIVRQNDYNGSMVKITIKGASSVERKNKQRERKPKVEINEENIDGKLNEIIKHLTSLGYGQEVLFNEIEELREYQSMLSKKSWTQLLKGKLIDLGLSEVISKETAGAVYEYLTNDTLKLL